MNLRFDEADERWRSEVRGWLEANLVGDFAILRGRGGPGDEHFALDVRREWERALSRAGWTCLGWPEEHGGRNATLAQQIIFHEEYARARAPGRMGHIGEELLGPTVIAFGTDAQKKRFLPPIRDAKELWCQGYSEPNAGSDLANVQMRAERVGDEWVLHGQKIWTSHAHVADWCFALCRTDPAASKHRGLSYLLVPMHQPGIEIRPIQQMTGTSEFNEVFFDGAKTEADLVVGEVNGGWRVAMGTLAFERGVSTLGQQLAFENELAEVVALAKSNGAMKDARTRDALVKAWMGLRVMRLNALRTLGAPRDGQMRPEAMIGKLYWSNWHRALGELAMQVVGIASEVVEPPYELDRLQRLFLFSRADTIYAGSNEIQRNIIGERALGLPQEPKP
ncbi:MAG TPA: acyl-CoA dehydrogenase family protein [Polyangiaceae bacterium]|jgi:alkylation response protein AidB-like acyl-CoA dehydrogenase